MEVRLSRELRLVDITMIGVGAMIGAGIFVLTGIAAGVAGPALILVFALNGVVALLTAMAYAELGSAFHDAGGGYLWVKTSLPDPNGFLSGWMSWFAHAVACSLYALGFGAYFRLVLEAIGAPEISLGFLTLEQALAVLVTVLLATVNYRGASETGKAGNVVTVGKVVIIGAFIAAGLWVMAQRGGWRPSFQPFLSGGWTGVFAAMGLTFIAFEGYEIIAQTSEEVENPKRNVPRAVFLSLLIVVPIYLLVAFVAIGAVTPPAGLGAAEYLGREKETALVSAADQFVRGGGIAVLVGGLLSTVSALNATIYSSSRVAFAMARDANLPAAIGRVHPARATPHVAIALSALIVIGMAVWLPIEDVAAAADIMFLLLFIQVNVAVIRLRALRPDLDRGFRVPWMPWIPVLAIVTMVFLGAVLLTEYPLGWMAVLGWLLIGGVVYYGYGRKREIAQEAHAKWMQRIERREYRVLVTVSNPETMPSLVAAATVLASERGGEVVVLAVSEVPEGVSLMTGRNRARDQEPLLDQAIQRATAQGVPARSVVKIAHRVSDGILQTAREEDCNFLMLGQPAATSLLERLVASITERVLDAAPCQVGILYGRLDPTRVRAVVVPVTDGANSRLAASLAPVLGRSFRIPVRALTVVPPGDADPRGQALIAAAQDTLQAVAWTEPGRVVRSWDPAQAIVDAVGPDDLIVLGAPSTDPVAALVGETIPSALAARRRAPMMVVRDVAPRPAWRFQRFFLGTR